MDLWDELIGARLKTAPLSEKQLFRLGICCAQHALNRGMSLFKHRIEPDHLEKVRLILSQYNIGAAGDPVDLEAITASLDSIFPKGDSEESMTPGWSALIDCLCYLRAFLVSNDLPSLYYAIKSSYWVVARIASAEYFGSNYNCQFGSEEREVEANNEMCQAEILFQHQKIREFARNG